MKTTPSDIMAPRTGREVYIVTTGQIINARTAGARRVLNIAKSLAYGNVKVFIFSFIDFLIISDEVQEIQKGVYAYCKVNQDSTDHPRSLPRFLSTSYGYIKKERSETVVFLYPTTFIFRDFIYLWYFKYLKGLRFFCEINELRSSIAFSSNIPEGLLRKFIYLVKSIRDYCIYTVNEWQVNLYDGITVISVALENYFVKRARRLIRIPILCNSDDLTTGRATKTYEGGTFKICFAGYIKIEKEGFDILIESLSKVNRAKPVELYLYGIMEDADGIQLKNLAGRYGFTGNVFYRGNVDPDMLRYEFLKYHLLILPRSLNRRTRYGLSTKLADYMVSGTPVLVTDVSDNGLLIQDGYNGFIIPPGSAEIMSEKIFEIIRLYNSIAHEVVKNAHKTVREQLDYKLFSQQYIDFFFSNVSKNIMQF